VEGFETRLRALDAVPTIIALQEHLESIRQEEIVRARGRLGQLTSDQENAIAALTRGIVNKILHTPISVLKNSAGRGDARATAELVHRMFDLRALEAPTDTTPRSSAADHSGFKHSSAASRLPQ
jgi:glutamyl-tRNA reductase